MTLTIVLLVCHGRLAREQALGAMAVADARARLWALWHLRRVRARADAYAEARRAQA